MKYRKLSIFVLALICTTSCSNDIEDYLCDSSKSKTYEMSTRSCTNGPDDTLVCITETPELTRLKNLYMKQRSKLIRTSSYRTADSYYFSNMYAIRELPATIKVKAVANGSSSSYAYFNCPGAGKEVTLGNTAYSSCGKFYIRILPASTGIPYLIYSDVSKTPLTVGYYTSNPNNKILMASATSSESLFSAGWNLIPSSYNGYFTIQSESYLGQADPNNSMSIFYYVLEAQANNKLGYARLVSDRAQQYFQIVPDAKFELESIEYDLSTASISFGGYTTMVQTKSNMYIESKNLDFPFAFNTLESSYFSKDDTKISVGISNDLRKFARPKVCGGQVMLPSLDDNEDATYVMNSYQNIKRSINYTLPLTADPKTNYTVIVKFKYYNVSINYIVKAHYITETGDVREFVFTGKWFGKIYEDPNVVKPEFTYTKKSIDGDGDDIILSRKFLPSIDESTIIIND